MKQIFSIILFLCFILCVPVYADTAVYGSVTTNISSPHYRYRGIASFTFDDGYDSVYTIAKPVFDSKSVVGTLYVTTSYIDTGSYITTEHLNGLYSDGWEIGGHTVNHVLLADADEATIRSEFSDCNTVLEGMGYTVRNTAYPGGSYDALVGEVVLDYYRSGRRDYGVRNESVTPITIMAQNADDINVNLETYKLYALSAYLNEKWVIYYFHDLTEAKASLVGQLIDYIQGFGMEIVTLNEGLDIQGIP